MTSNSRTENYSSREENEQRLRVEEANCTLQSIDMDKVYSNVMERHAHKVDANELMRVRSYGIASSRGLI